MEPFGPCVVPALEKAILTPQLPAASPAHAVGSSDSLQVATRLELTASAEVTFAVAEIKSII